MKRLKSKRHLQRFVSTHDPIANSFHFARHDIRFSHYHELRAAATNLWTHHSHISDVPAAPSPYHGIQDRPVEPDAGGLRRDRWSADALHRDMAWRSGFDWAILDDGSPVGIIVGC